VKYLLHKLNLFTRRNWCFCHPGKRPDLQRKLRSAGGDIIDECVVISW
jgi:hypothetical protein